MLPRMDGSELKQIREALRLSQADLGSLMDVPQATISRWESGKVTIERPRMLALALEALCVRYRVDLIVKDTSDG